MQNKPKFKVGDEVIFFHLNKKPHLSLEILRIKHVIPAISGLNTYLVERGLCRYQENELLTKEEALIKLQEFLNEK